MNKPKMPDRIYLIDMGAEGIEWCIDPAPVSGMVPGNAVEYVRVDAAAQQDAPTDAEWRLVWKANGGSFHGPNVETATMPEAKLFPFLRRLMSAPAQDADPRGHCQCPACVGGVIHASSCALHNGPAYDPEPCDCGANPGEKPDPYRHEYPARHFREAYLEWENKTQFIQEWMSQNKLPVKYLGWHRADVMRDLIESAAHAEKEQS